MLINIIRKTFDLVWVTILTVLVLSMFVIIYPIGFVYGFIRGMLK
jgi:hypothetical protein